jgi:hypothetical protein
MNITVEEVSTITGLASTAVSVAIWLKLQWQTRFDEQRIVISLVIPDTDKRITLPCRVERKHLTRAEVQGILGTIPMIEEKPRYSIKFFNSREFYSRLESAQDVKSQDELLIDCTEAEIKQFDLNKIKETCTVFGF